MGFFQTLGHILGGRPKLSDQQQQHLIDAWKLYEETPHGADSFPEASSPAPTGGKDKNSPGAEGAAASPYDRAQWHKKVKTILEKLPESQSRWAALTAEIGPLALDADWVRQVYREEFTLLVRRAVADGVVSTEDHKKLDLARHLLGLSETEAEEILHAVIAENRSLFRQTGRGWGGLSGGFQIPDSRFQIISAFGIWNPESGIRNPPLRRFRSASRAIVAGVPRDRRRPARYGRWRVAGRRATARRRARS